jgi:predicted ATP-grasp superfamily ATP-dependent carboligase
MSDAPLLIIGASARAAAFSALRAGLQPWGIDRFHDTDLQAVCRTVPLPPASYPQALVIAARQAPPGPWLYTGGMENRPEIIRQIARERPLWGNSAATLRKVRSPRVLARLFASAGLPHPAVRFGAAPLSARRRWLVKPRLGAGGAGIQFWQGGPLRRRPHFFQEFIDGDPCSAVYVGDGERCQLLGITRQLVGWPWLHAAPFHYCGSIGPWQVGSATKRAFQHIGAVLTRHCQLRGLFGVDCMLRDGVPWPIEVNPRYTASVEVVEFATGISALALHRRAFDPASAKPQAAGKIEGVIGKAILFAPAALTFPPRGPWQRRVDPFAIPDFADIPPAGQLIRTGRPVLTFFARAATEAECLDRLRKTAAALDRRLFGR